MASVNKWIGVGSAGRDTEVRYTANGMAIGNTSIACSFKTKDEEKTEWVNLVFMDKLAEIAGEYVTKGKQIYVEGRLQTRKWQDKVGADRYSTEVVVNQLQLLGSRTDGEARVDGSVSGGGRPAPQSAPRSKPAQQAGFADMDDDIPFVLSLNDYSIASSKSRRLSRAGF